MLKYLIAVCHWIRKAVHGILQPLLVPPVPPYPVPVRLEARTESYRPAGNRSTGYSRIHPPSTTQL